MHRHSFTLLAIALLAGSTWQQAAAQLPATRLEGVFPAGAAPGTTVDLVLAGTDLDEVSTLVFSHPGIKAERKLAEPTPFDEGPQPVENTFVVTLDKAVPPGLYEVRANGYFGRSNPRPFVVGSRSEVAEVEPNNQPETATEITLPITINGQIGGGGDVDWYKFTAAAGQRWTVTADARRLDSRAVVVLAICTSEGRILAESQPRPHGDPILDWTAPGAGTYWLRATDAFHRARGGNGYSYRVTVAASPQIASIYPPAGPPGSNLEYTVLGYQLPGGRRSSLRANDQPLDEVRVRIAIPGDAADKLTFRDLLEPQQAGLDGLEYRLPDQPADTPAALLTVASRELVLEANSGNDQPALAQPLTTPVEVAGRFYPQRDVDWYTFTAEKDQVLWIELFSHRLGLPTDPALLIQRVEKDEKGAEKVSDVAYVDDVPAPNRDGRHEFDERTTDPWHKLVVPAAGKYRVLLRESLAAVRSDARLAYRLVIRPPDPDFRLVAVPMESAGSLLLRQGGRDGVRVLALRREGFAEPITLEVAGLPAGVKAEPVTLGPSVDQATIVLLAEANAPAGVGTLQIRGKATIAGREVVRAARFGYAAEPFQFNQPNANLPSARARCNDSLQVCVSDKEKAPLALAIGDDPSKVLETARGGIVKLNYKVAKTNNTQANLIAFPLGLPPNVNAQQVNIGGGDGGNFEIRLQANTPPGRYSFYLAGFAQNLQYERLPDSVKAAKARQERVNKILTDAQTKVRETQQAAQNAQNALSQANNELTQATTQKQAADRALAEAEAAAKRATEALAAAEKALAEKPDDAGRKQARDAAKKAADEAGKRFDQAKQAATDAQKKLEAADAKQKAAQTAKAKADQDQQTAQQFAQQAQQEKQRTDQRTQQVENTARRRGYNAHVASNPLTLVIEEYPITAAFAAPSFTVKQGDKLDIPLKITRKYDFKSNVSVQHRLPGGVGGLNVPNINIGDNQLEGKIAVQVQPNATPGAHTIVSVLQMNFNGQGLSLERSFVLQVEEVKK